MDSLWLIPLLPGLVAVANVSLAGEGRWARMWSARAADGVAIGGLLASCVLSARAVAALRQLPSGLTEHVDVLGDWMPKLPAATRAAMGIIEVPWSLRLDPKSSRMLIAVLVAIAAAHAYGTVRIAHGSRARSTWFSACVSWSACCLTLVALGSSLPMLFAGWLGATLSGLLLYRSHSRDDPFPVPGHLGMVAFMLAIAFTFVTFGSLDTREVERGAATTALEHGQWGAASTISFLIVLGIVTAGGVHVAASQRLSPRTRGAATDDQKAAWVAVWISAAAGLGVLWQISALAVRTPLAVGAAVAIGGLVTVAVQRRWTVTP